MDIVTQIVRVFVCPFFPVVSLECWVFKKVSGVFQGCFEGVWREFEGFFKEVIRIIQGGFRAV